jgi:hypothetical protein
MEGKIYLLNNIEFIKKDPPKIKDSTVKNLSSLLSNKFFKMKKFLLISLFF